MSEANIFSLDDIAERTSGFSMSSFNKHPPQLFILGIGSNDDVPDQVAVELELGI